MPERLGPCLTCKGQGVVQTFGGTGVPTFPPRLVVCPECHGRKMSRDDCCGVEQQGNEDDAAGYEQ
jgi:DnaJ-class molecular chaperone